MSVELVDKEGAATVGATGSLMINVITPMAATRSHLVLKNEGREISGFMVGKVGGESG